MTWLDSSSMEAVFTRILPVDVESGEYSVMMAFGVENAFGVCESFWAYGDASHLTCVATVFGLVRSSGRLRS